MTTKALRSSGNVDDTDISEVFPMVERFQKEKLPTYKEVIGLVRNMAQGQTYDEAISDVSSILLEHWVSRNIYTVSRQMIKTKLKADFTEFRNISKTHKSKQGETWKKRFQNLKANRDKLFDIFCENEHQRAKLEERYCIPMLEEDYEYLQSMRTDRSARCHGNIDKEWHHQQEKKEHSEALYVQRQTGAKSFAAVSSSDIALTDESSVEDESTMHQVLTVDTEYNPDPFGRPIAGDIESGPTKRKRAKAYVDIKSKGITHTITRSQSVGKSQSLLGDREDDNDPLPEQYRHIRRSERLVRDEVYQTMAELDGYGFSYRECQLAILVVGNTMFGRKWKMPSDVAASTDVDDEEEGTAGEFDTDTLPTIRRIRGMLKNITAYSLKLVAERVIEAKEQGAVITHATDSTTRKGVGAFAPAGLHINKDEYLPLPTIGIATETTENTADAIAVDFRLLEVASGHTAEELYKTVDVHMTDSTAHNKGVAAALAAKFNRDKAAGQIFCDSHTTLGFDRGMSKIVNSIEEKMGMQNLYNGFLLDLDIDQRKDTVSMTTVSWALSLFGPDNIQKPWNYYKDFKVYMQQQDKPTHLFLLKDARFGALSKSCAIMCHHWGDFSSFLGSHEYITNKLACLVRDALALEYIQVVISVVAAFGLHLVAPFHAKTISSKATHTSLAEFFESLHSALQTTEIDEEFFHFLQPIFSGISQNLFDAVKANYKLDVVESVREMASTHIKECVSLANRIRPKMADVLGMQRGKYYDFGGYEKEYPVFEQAQDIDKTPVHNLQLERQCGDTDHRLKKKPSLDTVSRGNILKLTRDLRQKDGSSDFRKMGPVVKIMDNTTADWNKRQQDLRAAGLSKKEANLLHVENRKLNILERLKDQGGPFTSAEHVDEYLKSTPDDLKTKTKRMRDEVTYARDTSVSLPRSSHVFRMFNTEAGEGRKRKMLTPEQFGENLKILLGKTKDRSTVTLSDFCSAMEQLPSH